MTALTDARARDARNSRVAERYDVLMRESKHGLLETIFRIVNEEVEAALDHASEPDAVAVERADINAPGMRETIAAAIANARGMRRGVPTIKNILDILPAKLRDEVIDDAENVLAELARARSQP